MQSVMVVDEIASEREEFARALEAEGFDTVQTGLRGLSGSRDLGRFISGRVYSVGSNGYKSGRIE